MKNLKKLISADGLPLTFVIFYTVGLVLNFFSLTRPLFIYIVPYTLLIVTAVVFFFHKEWNLKTVIVLLFIFSSGVLIEIIGVSTGKVFGLYNYGRTLGLKVADVPVIIGLNWVILVYSSNAIVSKITSKSLVKITVASMLMVIYDLVLERAASLMNMWEFKNACPPFRNYFMWFVLSLIFQSAMELFKLNTENKPARALFVIQFLFFTGIIVINLFIIR
jgi:uncharacterized membrane protein